VKEYNVTHTSIQGTLSNQGQTTMSIQNRVKGIKYSKYRAKTKWNMGHNLKGRHKVESNSKLCSEITISLLNMRISRICSHQSIDDHRKKRRPHT